jgi:nucleoside-triphosphatase
VRFLVEARPGAGKTTALRRMLTLLREAGVPLGGFTTEELRERGRRVGFAVESVDGERATLAHVDRRGPPRVGRYGVDLRAFERIALPALRPRSGCVVLVDEIGRMELASERFRSRLERLLDEPAPLVATIQSARDPFTDRLKRRPGVELVRLTTRNRDELPARLAERLGSWRHPGR